MAVRPKGYFRARMTTEFLEELQDAPIIQLAAFIRDIAVPGITNAFQAGAEETGTWNLRIPIFTAYTWDTALRILSQSDGILSLLKSGDYDYETFGTANLENIGDGVLIEDLSLPAGSNERWISVGAIYGRRPLDRAVDGYGDENNASEADSFHFRVVYGDVAPVGTAVRPDKSLYFTNGILLADIRLLPGMSGVTQDDVYEDRLDWFSLKTQTMITSLEVVGQDLNQDLNYGHRDHYYGDVATTTGAGLWAHIWHWDWNFIRRMMVSRLTIVASPEFQVPAADDDSIFQFSKSPAFSSPANITFPQNLFEAGYSIGIQLNIEAGEKLYMRVTQAGKHRKVYLQLEYYILEKVTI